MKESYPINELKLNADFTGQEIITKKLTQEEILELKDALTETSIKLSVRERASRAFSDALKLNDQEGVIKVLEDLKMLIYADLW